MIKKGIDIIEQFPKVDPEQFYTVDAQGFGIMSTEKFDFTLNEDEVSYTATLKEL